MGTPEQYESEIMELYNLQKQLFLARKLRRNSSPVSSDIAQLTLNNALDALQKLIEQAPNSDKILQIENDVVASIHSLRMLLNDAATQDPVA